MIYPDNFEYKIGFAAVRNGIRSHCVSASGVRHCDGMAFMTGFDEVESSLCEVAELVAILNGGEDLPLHNVRDIDPLLRTLDIPGMFLTAEELSSLRKCLTAMEEISSFFATKTEEGTSRYPRMSEVASGIETFRPCIAAINRVVDPLGDVKDSASPVLADIRRQLSSMSGTINSVMRRVMANAVKEGYIDSDTAPAMRDGRLVLPVQPMYKRRINGIVHDESASGKTVFIEPAEVVEVNNRMRELQIEERREIRKILLDLATEMRPYVPAMSVSSDLLGLIDFIHAKAVYAREVEASMPNLHPDPQMELYHACHPGLQASLRKAGKEIVPLDIVLTPDKRLLVISGPNAGGKSVCLKTVGVIQYMTQCGVLPTVYENSHIGLFDDIFMDIGDDQSIEDDLSTYSSHLRNMTRIIRSGRASSLVLIDEFGGGTEPQIGGAIAQAILKKINELGMWGVITTHYQNLKHFAEDTDGLVNGSMLYDRQRMKPLFQLSIGHPGSSFAIEIARKTGLPSEIIDDAQSIVGSDYVNMDKYLLDIARDRRYWENKRLNIRQKEKKIEETLERYNAQAEELRLRRNEIISEAKTQAKSILEGSNAAIERTIHEIRRAQAEKEATLEARKEMAAEKERLLGGQSAEHKLLKKVPKSRKKPGQPSAVAMPAQSRQIAVGDVVKLDGEGVPGKVMELRGKQATVVFGQLKTTVAVGRLRHTDAKINSGVKREASFISESTSAGSRARQLEFSRQIDVRGMRADEAVQAVTYYIDDALQFNAGQVRILHGTGTGALRQAIRSYLDTVPGVRSFHDEHVQFGGAGITVVELD